MLGGGTFVTQNKKLPGTYINFISASRAAVATSDRGVVAMGLELDWGVDGEVFKVSGTDFIKNSLKIFGYEYGNEKLKGLRDLFLNATTLYAYKLNSGGEKAANTYAKAKHSGIRGNNIKIVIQANIDDAEKYDVYTLLDTKEIDRQTVSAANELVDNDYVEFIKDSVLEVTAGIDLAGGTNEEVTGEIYQEFLSKIEGYSFNAIGCLSEDETIQSLYAAFTKRMREEMGVKFQAALFNKSADYEGVVNAVNKTKEGDTNLIYWITGVTGACEINKSNTNKVYNGEFTVIAEHTQAELENAIDEGQFVFHKVGDNIAVLEDINSLKTITSDKNEDFKSNQTIRVLDQSAIDTALTFNTQYLGKIPNNEAGRLSLWNDIVSIYKGYEALQAIEDYSSDDTAVEAGVDKKSVSVSTAIKVISAMSKLYQTVVVG